MSRLEPSNRRALSNPLTWLPAWLPACLSDRLNHTELINGYELCDLLTLEISHKLCLESGASR